MTTLNNFFKNKTISYYYIKEIQLKEKYLSQILDSVYIGGGSPLEIPIEQLKPLLNYLHHYTNQGTEYTIESNPNWSPYEDYYSYFNRISIGIQSFHSNDLKMLGRDYQVSFDFLKKIKKTFKNISYDLIFDIPNQTINNLNIDIKYIKSLSPKHVSYYLLEDNNITNSKRKNTQSFISESALHIEKQMKQFNYKSYELSNYSKSGYKSIHNQAYWNEKDYMGIGPGASGRYTYNNNVYRYQNYRNLNKYIQSITNNHLPIEHIEKLSTIDIINEYLMINIRRPKGINIEFFNQRFNKNIIHDLNPPLNKHKNNLLITKKYIKLKKNIINYNNDVISDLFY